MTRTLLGAAEYSRGNILLTCSIQAIFHFMAWIDPTVARFGKTWNCNIIKMLLDDVPLAGGAIDIPPAEADWKSFCNSLCCFFSNWYSRVRHFLLGNPRIRQRGRL